VTVSRPRRSAAVSERPPRSSAPPDCLSHGGSRGFKSPHLHPTTALVIGLAEVTRQAGNLLELLPGQQTGSNLGEAEGMTVNSLQNPWHAIDPSNPPYVQASDESHWHRELHRSLPLLLSGLGTPH
jgi:hypothetical protein